MSDYSTAQQFLLGLKARGVSLGLDRMHRFAAALGDPHAAVPCIHVAGTNGKGSVAAMLEAILRAAGWRTGLYTSPHLIRLGERIQVDRLPLSDDEIAAYVSELRSLGEAPDGPSYFEFMTGLAFLHFARRRCDIAVIEVGLGGRLDATNLVNPEVSVITSIGLDHCELLGPTLAAIATEKAGIVKPGRPVVIGRLPVDAESAIRPIAAARGATVISVEEEFGDNLAHYPRTSLAGDYQRWNAGTATLAARALPARWRMADAVIAAALLQVDWPARWQSRQVGGRTVIIDSSHNAEGATVLDANLSRLGRSSLSRPSRHPFGATGLEVRAAEFSRAPIAIVGVLGAVRARPILATLCRYVRELRLVVPAQSRACTYEQLEGLIPSDFRGAVVRDTVENLFPSFDTCAAGDAGDTIVVAGSIYLAGEVLARLDPAGSAGEPYLQDF